MLRGLISSAFKIRLALWAVEQALPSEASLRFRLRTCLKGVIAAVAGGVMAACTVCAAIIGGAFALHYYGDFTTMQAFYAAIGTAFIGTMALLMYGYAKLQTVFDAFDLLTSSPPASEDDVFSDLVNGFLKGFCTAAPGEKPAPEEMQGAAETGFGNSSSQKQAA